MCFSLVTSDVERLLLCLLAPKLNQGDTGSLNSAVTSNEIELVNKELPQGPWGAPSVERPTHDLSSGHVQVVSSGPVLGSTLGMEPTSETKTKRKNKKLPINKSPGTDELQENLPNI